MKIFVDFDNTIVNTSKAYVDVYNKHFSHDEAYRYVNWRNVQRYDLQSYCPQDTAGINIFETPHFFRSLSFLDHDAESTLKALNEKFEIWICTIGTPTNLEYKLKWIGLHLPFIKNAIYLNIENNKHDKSIINMGNSFFLDDNLDCLDSSNAIMKIVFGREVDYNKTKKYNRIISWKDCYNYFNK